MPEWEGGIAPSPDSPKSSPAAGATAACRGGMKIPSSLEWGLLVAATVLNGILAGGSLIKSVVELPARRTIGLPAMAAFHRAADLRTGFWIYPALGLGAPILTIALAIAFAVDRGAPMAAASFGYLAAALSLAHVFATTRAAPNLLKLRSGVSEEAVLAGVYRGFTRWQTVRAIFQLAGFVAVVLAWAFLAPLGQ